MNIKEAKEQIQNAMTAYFTRDANGDYIVPIEKQRPVFLMGPPGIGKTAIMEQIAADMNVGLLSYSMTHHTRQSALGLPVIKKKVYDGKEYDISEYTMSEIIASIYDLMENTGVRQGILFLDEVNCVSETLSPVMLQFLQYKVFGRHRVPEGWIVVTAGNPPEYNDSVREFDIVTWDRLKRIDVEPEYEAWKEYAYARGIHPAVTSFLEVRKKDFYRVESTADGKIFATARGWEDLSQMIKLYEMHDFPVSEQVISQYIQAPKISRAFAVYYDLYRKYQSDYKVRDILSGKNVDAAVKRASAAKFDERVALLGMLLDAVSVDTFEVIETNLTLTELAEMLRDYRVHSGSGRTAEDALNIQIDVLSRALDAAKASQSETREKIQRMRNNLQFLRNYEDTVKSAKDGEEAFKEMKKEFDKRTRALKKSAKDAGSAIENLFLFLEQAFGDGQEMIIAVTQLTVTPHTSEYIARYGSDGYFRHNDELMFHQREKQIRDVIKSLSLDKPDGGKIKSDKTPSKH